MILIPILALFIGAVVAWYANAPTTGGFGNYVSVAALAGMDTVIGGVRSAMEDSFNRRIFVSGFAVNAITAAGLAYAGDMIGLDLFLAAVVVLGGRIFVNLSVIRRHILTRIEQRRGNPVVTTQASE